MRWARKRISCTGLPEMTGQPGAEPVRDRQRQAPPSLDLEAILRVQGIDVRHLPGADQPVLVVERLRLEAPEALVVVGPGPDLAAPEVEEPRPPPDRPPH